MEAARKEIFSSKIFDSRIHSANTKTKEKWLFSKRNISLLDMNAVL